MNTTISNITYLIAKLESHLARLRDGLAAKPLNEQAAYWRTFDTAQRTISGLKNDDLDKAVAQLAERQEHRAAVLKKQASLEEEIASAQDWRTFPNAQRRDREFDRQRTLTMQLQMLHEGTLLIAPGIATGRLSDIDARIAELERRLAMMRERLASHVEAAQGLLGEVATCTGE